MSGASGDIRTRPFQLTPDPRYFYCGSTHGRVLSALLSAIDESTAPVVLIGHSGTGKTALIHKALLELPPETYAIFLRYTTLNANDLVDTLAGELGVAAEPPVTGDVMAAVRQVLRDIGRRGRPPLVLVDEAQNLCEVGLGTLCKLAWDGLIRLVVVGQERLCNRVTGLQLSGLQTSQDVVLELGNLAAEEVRELVRHRLQVAGEDPDAVFSPEAYPLIFEHTSGNPGRVNTLCERALKFHNSEGSAQSRIEAFHIEAASLELGLVPELMTGRTAVQPMEELDVSVHEERASESLKVADAVDSEPAADVPSGVKMPSSIIGSSRRYTALTLGAMILLIALTSWLIEVQFADDGKGMAAPNDDLSGLKAQLVTLNEALAETSAKQDALLEVVAALRLENRELREQVDASSSGARSLDPWKAPVIEDFAALETALVLETKRPRDTERAGSTERPRGTYRVRAGDTLYGIARRNSLAVGDLARWNGLENEARLLVGDRLVLSPREELDYTVRRGDTLTGLKQRFGVSFDEVRRWNNLSSDGRLYAGQHLKLYVSTTDDY